MKVAYIECFLLTVNFSINLELIFSAESIVVWRSINNNFKSSFKNWTQQFSTLYVHLLLYDIDMNFKL